MVPATTITACLCDCSIVYSKPSIGIRSSASFVNFAPHTALGVLISALAGSLSLTTCAPYLVDLPIELWSAPYLVYLPIELWGAPCLVDLPIELLSLPYLVDLPIEL